jgi:hypothetical protein
MWSAGREHNNLKAAFRGCVFPHLFRAQTAIDEAIAVNDLAVSAEFLKQHEAAASRQNSGQRCSIRPMQSQVKLSTSSVLDHCPVGSASG